MEAVEKTQPKFDWSKTWIIIGTIISWLTFWMFLLSPIGLLIWISILIYLFIKKGNLLGYFIFSAWVFVPCLSFLIGIVNYTKGSASLKGIGGPNTYHGIDADTRLPSISSGCMVIGFEPFVFFPNNMAVKLCTSLFGFQRGSYSGFFPTSIEAKEIVKSGDKIAFTKDFNVMIFDINGREIEIDLSEFYHEELDSVEFAIGKIKEDECLVFKFVSAKQLSGKGNIYLVDIMQQKLLTTYLE